MVTDTLTGIGYSRMVSEVKVNVPFSELVQLPRIASGNVHWPSTKEKKQLRVKGRAWFARLYGKINHELQRVDYRPYRRTNHVLSHL